MTRFRVPRSFMSTEARPPRAAGVPDLAGLLRGHSREEATRLVRSPEAPQSHRSSWWLLSSDADVHGGGFGLRARRNADYPRRRRDSPGGADEPGRRHLRGWVVEDRDWEGTAWEFAVIRIKGNRTRKLLWSKRRACRNNLHVGGFKFPKICSHWKMNKKSTLVPLYLTRNARYVVLVRICGHLLRVRRS